LFTHASAVQALPSSHCEALVQQFAIGAFTQPDAGLQESAVHTLPSSQLTVVYAHEPPTHVSVVQALLSSQSAAVAQGLQPAIVACWH
jgi:pyridoxine 5'-phosphate synthase PdxJ